MSARWPIGMWLLGAAVIAVAIAAGVALSKTLASPVRDRSDALAHEAASASVGALRFEPDPGWARLERVPDVPGFSKSASLAFAPHPGLRTVVIATLLPVEDATLLPAALRNNAPRPSAGRLAGSRAWYYRGLAAERWRLDTAVLPTSRGVVTVACAAPDAGGDIPLGCLDAVRSISVADAETLTLGSAIGFRLHLPGAIKRLDAARVESRRDIRRGQTPRAQQRAAAALRHAHAAAAVQLAPVAADARGGEALVDALRRTAQGYDGLERAAASRDPRAWARARARAVQAEQALGQALATVRKAYARPVAG